MGIVGRKVAVSGCVTDVNLSEDPSDSEIISHLDGAEDMVALSPVDGWEVVLGVRKGRVVREAGVIVVGAPPKIGDWAFTRRSAEDLTDEQVKNLIQGTFIDPLGDSRNP